MRLIDADALIEKKWQAESEACFYALEDVVSVTDIEEAPSIDIVRCKECKHRDAENGFCEGRGWPMQLVPDDGFCDKGERSRR